MLPTAWCVDVALVSLLVIGKACWEGIAPHRDELQIVAHAPLRAVFALLRTQVFEKFQVLPRV